MQWYYCLIPRAQKSVISSERSPSINQHPHVNHSIGPEFLPVPPSAQAGIGNTPWNYTISHHYLEIQSLHRDFVTQSLVKITYKETEPMTQRNIQGQATPGGGEKRWEVLRSGLNDTAKRSPPAPARPPPSFISRRSLQWAPASRSLPLLAAERLASAFQSRI